MLTRARAAVAVLLGAGLLALAPATPAVATHVEICDERGNCWFEAHTPGGGGGGGGGDGTPSSSSRRCQTDSGTVVPCYSASFGWWSNETDCYYKLESPQPPASDEIWEGHYPDGAIYHFTCLENPSAPGGGSSGGGRAWRPAPPEGYPPSPLILAQRAIDRMHLAEPDIGIVPKDEPGRMGYVGSPVWMWTSSSDWGPLTATAAVPGMSVTATARVEKIVWSMGDGKTVTCTKPGTPYKTAYGFRSSPDCGHRYTKTSGRQPANKYTVTATAHWVVDWAGGGESGQIRRERTSTTQIRIGELQVLRTKDKR